MDGTAYRRRVKLSLFCVAGVQVVTGALLAGGCVCAPSLRRVGLLTSAFMTVVFAANIGLGMWSQTRPLTAALGAVGVEVLLASLLKLPQIGPPAAAWYLQVPVVLLLLAAVIMAGRASRGQEM